MGPGFTRDTDRPLQPLNAVQSQGAEFRDSKPRIQQCPDNELLFNAPTRVGEPIGLLGPEGLADELVPHLFTCVTRWPVDSWSAIPNSVRHLERAGYQAGQSVNKLSRRGFSADAEVEQ
jgi:hypothetical protein